MRAPPLTSAREGEHVSGWEGGGRHGGRSKGFTGKGEGTMGWERDGEGEGVEDVTVAKVDNICTRCRR